MALQVTITNAGRAEIIAAENTGTNKVTIVAVAFGTARYTPTKGQTALQAEVKRVSSIAGQAVADDTLHVVALDESTDTYNVGEFGLITDKGTLLAVYSQLPAEGWIIQKAPASTLLLATDIILESLGTAAIQFGDVAFINPPATTSVAGVVMLEDSLTSSSRTKALTALQGKRLFDAIGNDITFAQTVSKALAGKQPLDATLTALAALDVLADKLIYATGADKFSITDFTAFARLLLAATDGTAARQVLGAAPINNAALTGTPTVPTAPLAVSNQQAANTEFVMRAISAVIDSSPESLNTLRELAKALGDDPNFATTMLNALAQKLGLAGGTMTGNIDSRANSIIRAINASGAVVGHMYSDGSNFGLLDKNGTWALRISNEGYIALAGELRGNGAGLVNLPQTAINGLAAALSSKLARGEYGLGAGVAPIGAIDTIGLPGGFYYFGQGATSFAQYVGLLNIPYGSTGYAGQIGFQQGIAEPRLFVRSVKDSGEWTPTRELFHSGNFDPAEKLNLKGGRMAGRLVIATDQGATPSYSVNQLELNDAGVGTPVSLGFHRAGRTAALLTHRGDGLEVLGSGGAALAPLAALLNGSNIVAGTVSATHLDTAVRGVSQGANDQDPNRAVSPVILSNHANTPDPVYYWHITTTFYAGIGETGNRGQLAVQYTPSANGVVRVYARSSYQGSWTRWSRCDNTEVAPPGLIAHFATTTPPTGWLKANGAAVSRTTYSDLFAAIGTTFGAGNGSSTFNLPDLRGEFIRSWSDGRTDLDGGRAFGTVQDQLLQGHTHSGNATLSFLRAGAGGIGGPAAAALTSLSTDSTSGGLSGETRPHNIALLACIRY